MSGKPWWELSARKRYAFVSRMEWAKFNESAENRARLIQDNSFKVLSMGIDFKSLTPAENDEIIKKWGKKWLLYSALKIDWTKPNAFHHLPEIIANRHHEGDEFLTSQRIKLCTRLSLGLIQISKEQLLLLQEYPVHLVRELGYSAELGSVLNKEETIIAILSRCPERDKYLISSVASRFDVINQFVNLAYPIARTNCAMSDHTTKENVDKLLQDKNIGVINALVSRSDLNEDQIRILYKRLRFEGTEEMHGTKFNAMNLFRFLDLSPPIPEDVIKDSESVLLDDRMWSNQMGAVLFNRWAQRAEVDLRNCSRDLKSLICSLDDEKWLTKLNPGVKEKIMSLKSDVESNFLKTTFSVGPKKNKFL